MQIWPAWFHLLFLIMVPSNGSQNPFSCYDIKYLCVHLRYTFYAMFFSWKPNAYFFNCQYFEAPKRDKPLVFHLTMIAICHVNFQTIKSFKCKKNVTLNLRCQTVSRKEDINALKSYVIDAIILRKFVL